MAIGKLGWQINPDVRASMEFVGQLKQLARTYHATSDPQVREAAQRRWDAALSQLFGADVESPAKDVHAR